MPKVETYTMYAWTGNRHKVRKATKVRIGGKCVHFSERLSKKEAIRKAKHALEKHPENFHSCK